MFSVKLLWVALLVLRCCRNNRHINDAVVDCITAAIGESRGDVFTAKRSGVVCYHRSNNNNNEVVYNNKKYQIKFQKIQPQIRNIFIILKKVNVFIMILVTT